MNKRTRIQSGLGFGLCMSVFYIVFDLVTTDQLNEKEIYKIIFSGIVSGAIAGFLFGWLIGAFAGLNFVKRSTEIKTLEDEHIIFHSLANHMMGMEGVGGKLYLSNFRLIFKSHKLNIQNHELSIPLEEILDVNRFKCLGIINRGLSIKLKSGKEEKFITAEAAQWMEYLEKIKPSMAGS